MITIFQIRPSHPLNTSMEYSMSTIHKYANEQMNHWRGDLKYDVSGAWFIFSSKFSVTCKGVFQVTDILILSKKVFHRLFAP